MLHILSLLWYRTSELFVPICDLAIFHQLFSFPAPPLHSQAPENYYSACSFCKISFHLKRSFIQYVLFISLLQLFPEHPYHPTHSTILYFCLPFPLPPPLHSLPHPLPPSHCLPVSFKTKIITNKQKMNENGQNKTWCFLTFGQLFLGLEVTLECDWYIRNDIPLEKTEFLFSSEYQLQIANSFSVRVGIPCSLAPLSPETTSDTNL